MGTFTWDGSASSVVTVADNWAESGAPTFTSGGTDDLIFTGTATNAAHFDADFYCNSITIQNDTATGKGFRLNAVANLKGNVPLVIKKAGIIQSTATASVVFTGSAPTNNCYVTFLTDTTLNTAADGMFDNSTSRGNVTFKFSPGANISITLEDGVYPHLHFITDSSTVYFSPTFVTAQTNSFGRVDALNLISDVPINPLTRTEQDLTKEFTFDGSLTLQMDVSPTASIASHRGKIAVDWGLSTVKFTPNSTSWYLPVNGDSNYGPSATVGFNTFNVKYYAVKIGKSTNAGHYAQIRSNLILDCYSLEIEGGAKLYGAALFTDINSSEIHTVKRPKVLGDWNYTQVTEGVYRARGSTLRLPVSAGGTGIEYAAKNSLVYGQGHGALGVLAMGTANQILTVNSGGTALEWDAEGGSANAYDSIAVSGQTSLAASAGDDLTFVAAGGMTITTNAGTDTITFSSADTTTNTQNEYATSWVDSTDDVLLRLTESGAGSGSQDIKMVAGSNITLTPSGTNMTIAATDTNTQNTYTATANGGIGLSGTAFSLDIDGMTDIGAPLVDADLMIVDDAAGGTNRKATMTRLQAYMQGALTFTTNTNTVDMGDGFKIVDSGADNEDVQEGEYLKFVTATGTLGTNLTGAGTSGDPFLLTLTSPDTDTVYTHPSSAGNKHIPTGGASGNFLKYDSSGTAVWATPSYIADTNLSTEAVQDIVGAMFTGNTETNTAVTYQDADGTIDVVTTLDGAPLTTEAVQDIVGGMFGGNTETRIAATYEDGDGTIDLVVTDMTTDTNTQNEYATSWVDSTDDVLLRLTESGAGSGTQDIKMVAGANVSLTPSGTNMTIAATDTDTVYTHPSSAGNIHVPTGGSSGEFLRYSGVSGTAVWATPSYVAALTTEEVQDIIGAMVSGNTETNIAVTYDDSDGTLDFVSTDTDTVYTHPTSAGNVHLPSGGATGNFVKYSGVSGVGSWVTPPDTNTQLTQEQVEDFAGGMFTSNTETLITATYQDADGTVDLVVDNDLSNYDNSSSGFITATLTTEAIQDIVGAMVTGNTETNIAVTYEDGDGTLDFVSTDTDTVYTHPTTAGNIHVPSGGASGNFLKYSGVSGVAVWAAPDYVADTNLSTEEVQDIVGGMFSGNTETNTAVTYDDSDGTIDVVTTLDGAPLTTEAVQDIVGAMVSGNTETNIAVTYQDADGTIDFVSTDTDTIYTHPTSAGNIHIPTGGSTNQFLKYSGVSGVATWATPSYTSDTNLSTEEVQDIVGAMFSSNTETRITVTYEDGDGTIDLVVDDLDTNLTTEEVQDIVGAMVSGNTESNISVTYQDGDGTLDFASTDTDTVYTHPSTAGNIHLPSGGSSGQFLKYSGVSGVGTWDTPAYVADTNLTTEEVQDIVGGMVAGNTETNIAVTYEDGDGTLDFVATDTQPRTDEYIQDIVGTMFTLNTETNTAVTYDDTDGTIDVVTTLDGAPLTTEAIQDIVGAMVSGNTETNIAVTYQDGDGTIDFVSTDTDTVYTHPTTAGNIHVPTGGSSGEFLKYSGVSGVAVWAAPSYIADTNLTTEEVQDIVGGMMTGNTETNIAVTYEDGDGTIDFVATDTQPLTTEAVQDIVGAMVTGNTETNIAVTYEDGDGTLDFVSTDTDTVYTHPSSAGNIHVPTGGSSGEFLKYSGVSGVAAWATPDYVADTNLTTEEVQDIVGAMFTLNTETNTAVTYDDADGTIDVVTTLDGAPLTTEAVQDIVGAMFGGNTETRIAATYQDGDGTIDLVVDDMTTDANTQNEYATSWVDSSADVLLRLTESGAGSGTQDIKLVAGSNVSLTPSGTNMTIASTDTDTVYTHPTTAGNIHVPTGGSAGNFVKYSGVSGVGAWDTPPDTQLTTEEVQDIVGAMVTGNTETNIAVTYEDGDGTLDFVATDTQPLTTEAVQDIVGGMVTGNTETNITVTYQDGDGTIDFAATDSDTQLSTEAVQDIVGAMFASNTETRITVSYDDSDGTIDLVVDDLNTDTQLTTEAVQDIVGGMLTGNTETNIAVTYQDGDGTIDFVSTDTDTVYTHPSSAGNIHVPTGGSSGEFLKYSGVSGVASWATPSYIADTNLSTEEVQDIVGAMFGSNTETRIAATYQDGDGTIDLVVDDMTADNNTTYSAGNGLALATTTFSIVDPATLDELDESSDATDDKMLLWDESASTWKYVTLDNLQDAIDTTSAGGAGEAFKTISVSGQDDVVADGATDTLTLVGGSNVTITTSAAGDSITFASTQYTHPSSAGSIHVPTGGSSNQFLKYSGVSGVATWATPSYTTDTNLTTEEVQDIVGAMFGSNTETRIGVTYDDSDGTIDLVVDDMTADTNTTYTAGTNITLSTTTFNVDDAFLKNDASDTTTGTITAGGFTTAGSITLGGHAFDDIDIGSEFVDTDDHLMSSGAIKEKIEDYGYTTATGDITGVTAGTGMSGGGTSGTVTLTNAGVTSNVAGSGIGVSGATGAVTITNSGVTSIVAGTNVSISGATGAVTINSTDQYTGDITGVTAGVGLSGGGSSGAISLALDFSELTDMTGDISGSTEFIIQNSATESRKAASEIKLSNFNNDSSWTANTGDITGVTAGAGLSGGGSSGGVTLAIDDPINLSELTESTDATDDKILLWDESASAWKYMTLDNLQDAIDTTGGGSGDMTGVDISVGTGLDISQSNTTSGSYTSTISLDLTEVTIGAGLDSTATGLTLDLNELTEAVADLVGDEDHLIYMDDGVQKQIQVESAKLSAFNNDSYNTWAQFFYQRDSIGTNAYDLRIPISTGSSSTSNGYPMPADGVVKAISIASTGTALSGTATQTFRVRKNGGTSGSDIEDFTFTADTMTNPNGNNFNFTKTGLSMAVSAGDNLQIKRNAGSLSFGHVNAIIYVDFS